MTTENALRAYVCLGSNCARASAALQQARSALAALPDMRAGRVSPVYRTEPQGYAEQPWFHNQVLELLPGASWRPCLLVDALLAVEADLGRVRSPDPALRFGPRVIDADLLLFGRENSAHPHCMVPHPRLRERAFALIPLLDVAPRAEIDGRPASWWLQRLSYRVEGDRIFQ
ncbi:2-amino-4-hydroxy-6-hydroxymethyldihydropteridine diphosphokinase [uncultured Desulfovibrio sp.]|uniref:2-amino-4-hydroxy-6- hydroxymethyldihydropteridine diphosphokinase n=1 Tax=uncultured Desulfovibrio sp. TaxID=167968 RepID=UPI0026261353|nr:2-amino-4-hydroxy-6-hydroxymethyldihydropteridine diphosphokinase [uncultured Desulfovibrio sp.]